MPASSAQGSQQRAGSVRAVIVAFVANVVVALAKSAAAVLTGSASMLAEAAHSWADAGNEVFLLVAERTSSRPRDEAHPLGFGRESYVWSMFAAIGVFIAGAVVSVEHGVRELFGAGETTGFAVAYVVLAVSAVVEGASLVQSVIQARAVARRYGRPTLGFVVNGSNATLRAVIAEDAAAVCGLLIAAVSIALHQITGRAAFDAIGSIAIGALLGTVAIALISRNRRYLVGEMPAREARLAVARSILAREEIERLTYLHLEFVGPAQLYVVAAVDLVGDRPEGEVARQLRDLEQLIEEDELVHTAVLTLSVGEERSLEL